MVSSIFKQEELIFFPFGPQKNHVLFFLSEGSLAGLSTALRDRVTGKQTLKSDILLMRKVK